MFFVIIDNKTGDEIGEPYAVSPAPGRRFELADLPRGLTRITYHNGDGVLADCTFGSHQSMRAYH